MKKYLLLPLLFLISCSQVYKPGDKALYKKAPLVETQESLNFTGLVSAIDVTVEQLEKTPNKILKMGPYSTSYDLYAQALKELREIIDSDIGDKQKFAYIQKNFYFVEALGEKAWGHVFVTGYYSPQIKGSYTKTKKYSEPLYAVPSDMLKVDMKAFEKALPNLVDMGLSGQIRDGFFRGRIVKEGRQEYVVPYYSREEINTKKQLAKVLCYVDPIDAFFMQIQGSGEVLVGNEALNINYADQNGHSYYPIGKALLDHIPIQEMSMQKIESHLRSLPKSEAQKIMNLNPSYVFFQKTDKKSVTAFGVQAQAGRSIATDAKFFPKGVLTFLVYPDPDDLKKSRSQFVFNHDAGGAIRGPDRVDLYWGKGDIAALLSGGLKGDGHLQVLFPNFNKKNRE